jgi:hypothetical protein
LRKADVGLGLAGVDEVDELDTVLDEEDGDVICASEERSAAERGSEGQQRRAPRRWSRRGGAAKLTANDVPVAFLSVKLGCESTNCETGGGRSAKSERFERRGGLTLPGGLGGSARTEDGRETSEGRSFLPDLGEDLSASDILKRGVEGESAVSSGSTGVNDALGDTAGEERQREAPPTSKEQTHRSWSK